ncbi:MAG: hypothetical protein RRA94_04950 [Bacteroidota bacterium]|nr:hypothetical protein [Bacteroidota bacterium]
MCLLLSIAAAATIAAATSITQAQQPFTAAATLPQAQQSSAAAAYESDILSARPIRYLLGVGPGMMWYAHGGSFSPSCDCVFTGESDSRFHFAGEVLVQYPKLGIAYGVLLSYYDASYGFTRDETRRSVMVGDGADVDVDYRSTSDVRLQWLSVTPEFLWYIPRSAFFLQAGLEFGFPLTARYDHIETIRSEDVTYYDGSRENVLLPEGNIPGGDGLRLAASFGLGYEFVLGPAVALTPRVGAQLPLTAVSSTDDDWRVTTAFGLLMLHLRL